MQIGVFTVLLRTMGLEQVLEYLAKLGVQAVELGTGGYPGMEHCPVDDLLASNRAVTEFLACIRSHGMRISSLSCHGNPLHPSRAIARKHDAVFKKTLRLAHKLGVEVVTTFSGCPGGARGDRSPNWVTCSWPAEYAAALEYQWNEVAIPYWRQTATIARQIGIHKIAIEMHPGFIVYNPDSLLRLREAVGPVIGANFDPSHLFWQGIDPSEAIRALSGAIWHVHAKDLAFHPWNSRINGVLETRPSRDITRRSWLFRTVGYGHDRLFWCQLVSALRMAGYDGVLSLEHEDHLMTAHEGLEKGIEFLQEVVFSHPKL